MGQAKEKKHFEGVNKIDAHNWHANSASDSNQHKTARTGIWVTSFIYDFWTPLLSIRSDMQDMDIIDHDGESAGHPSLSKPQQRSTKKVS